MESSKHRPRVCFIVSAPGTAATFLNPHIRVLSHDFEVSVIANVTQVEHRISRRARVIEVPIARTIDIRRDLSALLMLRREIRDGEFDIIHSVTPKAGLLTAVASIGLHIPNRLHWYTGQVWATKSGWKRQALKMLDRFIAFRSTLQLVDSPSQRAFLIEERVIHEHSSLVLAAGSICGVDTERFRPDPSARAELRQRLGIPGDDLVIVFVGRLNLDKGILDLATAFGGLDRHSDVHLLIVGADEAGVAELVRNACSSTQNRVHFVNEVNDPERYLAAADIFCLPSHREGFGLSVIEAAACELPAVVTDIYGLTDAVQEGITGLRVPPSDPVALSGALCRLLEDSDLRSRMGAAGRRRTIEQFGSSTLTDALLRLVLHLAKKSATSRFPT